MSTLIIVPNNLSEDEQVEYIRKAMIDQGIDPDSVYPISLNDPSMKPIPDEGITVTFSYNKEPT